MHQLIVIIEKISDIYESSNLLNADKLYSHSNY